MTKSMAYARKCPRSCEPSLIRWPLGRGSRLARRAPPDRRDLLNRELRHVEIVRLLGSSLDLVEGDVAATGFAVAVSAMTFTASVARVVASFSTFTLPESSLLSRSFDVLSAVASTCSATSRGAAALSSLTCERTSVAACAASTRCVIRARPASRTGFQRNPQSSANPIRRPVFEVSVGVTT